MLSWGVADVELLCERCGLCCDGTLYRRTPLAPGEVEALRSLGADPGGLDAAGAPRGPGLPQPCAALEGTLCVIYAARPARCRRYACLLRRALGEGELDLAEALGVVADARARAAARAPDLERFLDQRFRGHAGPLAAGPPEVPGA